MTPPPTRGSGSVENAGLPRRDGADRRAGPGSAIVASLQYGGANRPGPVPDLHLALIACSSEGPASSALRDADCDRRAHRAPYHHLPAFGWIATTYLAAAEPPGNPFRCPMCTGEPTVLADHLTWLHQRPGDERGSVSGKVSLGTDA